MQWADQNLNLRFAQPTTTVLQAAHKKTKESIHADSLRLLEPRRDHRSKREGRRTAASSSANFQGILERTEVFVRALEPKNQRLLEHEVFRSAKGENALNVYVL